MTTREEFVAYVRSLKGTPFKHQGRVPGVGLDCPGPLICACRRFGIRPPDFDVTGYPERPDGSMLKAICDEHMESVPLHEMKPADVLLVGWGKGPPQHLGIVFDYPHGGMAMLHADRVRAKAVTETRVEFGRAMRFVAAYLVPGVT